MLEEQAKVFSIVKMGHRRQAVPDTLAVEEPLEMRLAGETIATTMRTPGHDHLLAKGFLFCEGVVKHPTQIGRMFHCGRPGTPEYGNVIDVIPAPGLLVDFKGANALKRGTLVSASCGVCGRTQITDLIARCKPFDRFEVITSNDVSRHVDILSQNQSLFDQTGGVHAVAAFQGEGGLIDSFEDVGRHNATDKVIGKLFEINAVGQASVLVVSGRISFEIIQKAAMARIPVVIGISAPTSLAVDLARALNMTLVGFARDNRCNVYTG